MSAFDAICRGQKGCVLEAALELARDEYPELCINDYLAFLHRTARDFDRVRGNETEPEVILRLLGDYFFGELEFTGNTQNYYDPRNSYLCDVIDRRMGIPISLSVVFQFLSCKAGVHLEGINFPGHFLLAFPRESGRIYIDVFQCGQWLDWKQCEERLQQSTEGTVELNERNLQPMMPREILLRMLRNLKGIFSRVDLYRCLRVQERIAALARRDPNERRDLGILYLHNGKPLRAVRVFDELVREFPEFQEREVIKSYRSKANQQAVLLN